MNQTTFDFDNTVRALEQGLPVRSIMSAPLETIDESGDPAEFFERHAKYGFDSAPVRNAHDQVMGLFYRDEVKRDGPNAKLHPLHEVPIVAAETPVVRLIHLFQTTSHRHWLVLDHERICGIVTYADLGKFPVRMLAVVKIMRLEQLLTMLLVRECSETKLFGELSDERQKKLQKTLQNNAQTNEQIPLAEFLSFSDKVELLKRALLRKAEGEQIGGVVTMRDQLMHMREGESSGAAIDKFLQRLTTIDNLIGKWTEELSKPSKAPHPTPEGPVGN
jgi:hypothetical protein